MPTWDFHLGSNLFSTEEKEHLAKSITKLYQASGLPAFYVRVRFNENQPTNVYTGGESDPGFIVIQVWHLARTMPTDEIKKRFLQGVDKVLNPFMEAKGLDWEYYVNESPRDLWKINGLVPPPPNSEMEKRWVKENRAIGEREKL